MSEEKKFLDLEGVKTLWKQVNLNDYPNNETLVAILNAIDETKADKEELQTKADNEHTHDYNTLINIPPNELPEYTEANAGMNLQFNGKELYWAQEGHVNIIGDPVYASPVTGIDIDVITKATNPRTDSRHAVNRLYLNQFTGSNIVNIYS